MNNRKTEVERITKEQLAAVEKCMAANKVNINLRFNFNLTKDATKVLEEKGYTLIKTRAGFKLIIEKEEGTNEL